MLPPVWNRGNVHIYCTIILGFLTFFKKKFIIKIYIIVQNLGWIAPPPPPLLRYFWFLMADVAKDDRFAQLQGKHQHKPQKQGGAGDGAKIQEVYWD